MLGDGGRVVDLATGNGAIALLAAQYARRDGRRFSIFGLDYAEIDPGRVLATHGELALLLDDIEFRSGVRIEATGLDDGSVDLLTSQYGFEYAEQDAAIAEALRVLVPGGRIALILHHSESRVVELARDGLAQVQFCLQKEELDKRVAALVKVVGDARDAAARQALKDNPKAERLRHWLAAVEQFYAGRVLSFGVEEARQAGAILDRARAHRPGFEDIAIAATAAAHGFTVLTANERHFAPLSVPLINPLNQLPSGR